MRIVRRNNSPYWYMEARHNGKNYARSTKTTHKPTARKIADGLYRSIQIEVAQGPSKNICFKDAADRYMGLRKGAPSERGLCGTRNVVLRLIDGRTLLSEMTGKLLNDFVKCRKSDGSRPQTIKHGVNFICAVMKQARKEGYTVASIEAPVISVKATRLRCLSMDEEIRLLAELDPLRKGRGIPKPCNRPPFILKELQDNYDIVVLLLDTGARYGEIAKLRWDQVDLTDRLIKLWRSKVGNESIIFMTSRVVDVLSHRNDLRTNEFVFTNRLGGHRGSGCIGIRKAYRRAGIGDCTIHTLRHTHATRLVQNGLSIYEVKAVLGHTDITTTMRYAHLENIDVTQRARDVIEKLNNSGAIR